MFVITGWRENPLLNLWWRDTRRRRGGFLLWQIILGALLIAHQFLLPNEFDYKGHVTCTLLFAGLLSLWLRGLLLTVSTHRQGSLNNLALTALNPLERYWGRMLPLLIEATPLVVALSIYSAFRWLDGPPRRMSVLQEVGMGLGFALFPFFGAILAGGLWTLLTRSRFKAGLGYVSFFLLYQGVILGPLIWVDLQFSGTELEWISDALDFYTAPLALWALSLTLLPAPLIVLRLWIGRDPARFWLLPAPVLRWAGWWLGLWLLLAIFSFVMETSISGSRELEFMHIETTAQNEIKDWRFLGGRDSLVFGRGSIISEFDESLDQNKSKSIILPKRIENKAKHASYNDVLRVIGYSDGSLILTAIHGCFFIPVDRSQSYSRLGTAYAPPLNVLSHNAFSMEMTADNKLIKLTQQGPGSIRDGITRLEVFDSSNWSSLNRFRVPFAGYHPILAVSQIDGEAVIWNRAQRHLLRYGLDGKLRSKRTLVTAREWLRNTRLEVPWIRFEDCEALAVDAEGNTYFARFAREAEPRRIEIYRLPADGGRTELYHLDAGEGWMVVGALRIIDGNLAVLGWLTAEKHQGRTMNPLPDEECDWRVFMVPLAEFQTGQ